MPEEELQIWEEQVNIGLWKATFCPDEIHADSKSFGCDRHVLAKSAQ